MTLAETIAILRLFNEWQRGEAPLNCSPRGIINAIDVAVGLLERMEKMELALQDHHDNAMCKGCDHSHPLTQLRLAAYQQSKLYADTVFALEKSK